MAEILDKGIARDINGILYAYENKDELAFGTEYEEEEVEVTEHVFDDEGELVQLVPRLYTKKLPKEVLQRRRAIDGFGE